MDKDVFLTLKGLQFSPEDESDEAVETVTKGQYYNRNNCHYVLYEEAQEGTSERTKNVLKISDDSLELTKKGMINVHMVFQENKKNMTNYGTPFGNILIGIDTKSVGVREQDNQIKVDVDYVLEINYEHVADCKIQMDICSEEKMDWQMSASPL